MNANSQTAYNFKQPYALGEKVPPSNNFTGDVWIASLDKEKELNVPIVNVTFEPGCRNSWHLHSGGQILIATAGIGYYQEKGKAARRLSPGDIVEIAPNVVHWHGAALDSWFSHIAIKSNPQANQVMWLQPLEENKYIYATSFEEEKYNLENEALNTREQAIISIASYTGKGDLENLKVVLPQALGVGMTINEINELFIHAYAYCGFPRSLRGIQTFLQVIDERKEKGIIDVVGREASLIENYKSKYERGCDILEIISGVPTSAPKAGYALFAPTIERFLKEHLFADIFERDLLTYKERELATVSILAGVGGVEPMAYSHMKICMNLGITPQQLTALLNIIEVNLGIDYSKPLREVLAQLLKNK